MKHYLIFCLIILSAISGCKKNNNPPPSPPPDSDSVNFYFTSEGDEGNGGKPGYWKNGVRTDLEIGNYGGDALCIKLGSNVTTGGIIYQGGGFTRPSPCYWSESSRTDLPLLDPRGNGWVSSILRTINGDVIAVGTATDSLEFDGNSGWRGLPCVWADGEVKQLELINGFGPGAAIAIDGTTKAFYIVGHSYADNGFQEPCIWTNAAPSTTDGFDVSQLSSYGYGGMALDIYSTDNFNYIAGVIFNADGEDKPCYWISGQHTVLREPDQSQGAIANAICLKGSVVCVAGNFISGSGNEPCMWLNGVITELPHLGLGGEALSTSTTLDGDIYVGGYVNRTDGFGMHPCYWKNGELIYDSNVSLANPPTDTKIDL